MEKKLSHIYIIFQTAIQSSVFDIVFNNNTIFYVLYNKSSSKHVTK